MGMKEFAVRVKPSCRYAIGFPSGAVNHVDHSLKGLCRFDRFRNGKQLARLCGVTPWNASSGERQADAGFIKAGNRDLRRVLIEAAHRLRR